MSIHYFAYGSNMNPERMKKRKAFFTSRIFAKLDKYRLEFNKTYSEYPGRGAANIIPDDDRVVEGVLYETTDEGIKRLDRFEGYPVGYRREEVSVELSGGESVNAVVYIANDDQVADGLKPSKEYMGHLLAGKDLLSKEYVSFLESFETLD